jgi:hypothetical protein
MAGASGSASDRVPCGRSAAPERRLSTACAVAGLWVVLASPAFAACDGSLPGIGFGVRGSGSDNTERRTVPAFEAVSVGGDFDVRIQVGPERSVVITGDDNLLPLVRTEVRDGTLHIEAIRSFRSSRGIRLAVASPRLRAVSISGSGDVEARGFREEAFEAAISGSGDLLASGDARTLEVSVSGSGNAEFSGSADQLLAAVSGSGNVDARRVPARLARVQVAGSGDAWISVAEDLQATVSGSGNVGYLGEPRVTKRVSGSGSVERVSGSGA